MSEENDRPDPRLDSALIAAVGHRVDELEPEERLELLGAVRRKKIAELRQAVTQYGVKLSDQEAADILGYIFEPTEERYKSIITRFPELTSYLNRVLKRRA